MSPGLGMERARGGGAGSAAAGLLRRGLGPRCGGGAALGLGVGAAHGSERWRRPSAGHDNNGVGAASASTCPNPPPTTGSATVLAGSATGGQIHACGGRIWRPAATVVRIRRPVVRAVAMSSAGLWMGSLGLPTGFFFFFIIFLIRFTEAGAKPPRLMTLLTVIIPRRRLPSPPPKTFFARAPIMFCVVVWSVKRFWYTNVLL